MFLIEDRLYLVDDYITILIPILIFYVNKIIYFFADYAFYTLCIQLQPTQVEAKYKILNKTNNKIM